MTRWLYLCAILMLIGLVLYTPKTFAADLIITWTTQPGEQKDKEIAVFGDPTKGPDDPKAVKVLVQKDLTQTIVPEATIRKSFPTTDYLGITIRNAGETKWWSHTDGTYQFVQWTPNPVVVTPPPPPLPTLKSVIADALDRCLAKPVASHAACMKFIRDALKKETK